MPTCPKCNEPMAVEEVLSVGGLRDKPVSWRCLHDGLVAGGVHPVQIAHLHVGAEEEWHGRRTRIMHLAMQGAELLVFREVLDPEGHRSDG